MSIAVQPIEQTNETVLELSNGVRVRTIDAGSGPVVLLLHGNPDNADEWKTLIRLLKSDFRCIAPDLPGYGRRDGSYALPAGYDYSIAAQIGFVDAVLAALNIQGQITLVVHDIGGIMGVPWAAQHPDRLHGMIYTNTVAYPGFEWFALARRWGNPSPAGRVVANLSLAPLGWFGGWLFRSVFSRQNPQLSQPELRRFIEDFARNPIAKQTSLVEFRQLTRPGFFDGYDQRLKIIADAAPTRTLWGQGDPYIPDRFSKSLLAKQLTVLPGVGHWVPILAAQALAKEIRSIHGSGQDRS